MISLVHKIKEQENRISTPLMLYSVLFWGNKTQVFYCWETTTEKQKKFFTDIKVASYRHPHSLLYLPSFIFTGGQQRLAVWDSNRSSTRPYVPTAPRWPPCAAVMSGVLPAWSAAFTCALWLSSSCRHSTWSPKAAAWRGVLRGHQRQHSCC